MYTEQQRQYQKVSQALIAALFLVEILVYSCHHNEAPLKFRLGKVHDAFDQHEKIMQLVTKVFQHRLQNGGKLEISHLVRHRVANLIKRLE